MAQGTSNGRNGGLIVRIIDHLTRWIDRPWKAVFIFVVLLVGAIGYAAYQERANLIRVFTASSSHPAVLRGDLEPVVVALLAKTAADAVAVLAVNVGANRADLKLGKRRGNGKWESIPDHLQWVTDQSDPLVVAKLLRGEPTCNDPAHLRGLLAWFLSNDGIIYACYVPEPPSSTETVVGLVVLAWRAEPDERIVKAALATVQAQTDYLIMH